MSLADENARTIQDIADATADIASDSDNTISSMNSARKNERLRAFNASIK